MAIVHRTVGQLNRSLGSTLDQLVARKRKQHKRAALKPLGPKAPALGSTTVSTISSRS